MSCYHKSLSSPADTDPHLHLGLIVFRISRSSGNGQTEAFLMPEGPSHIRAKMGAEQTLRWILIRIFYTFHR